VLVLTWNIQSIRGAAAKRLAEIVRSLASKKPDVVVLQEVGNDVAKALVAKLNDVGLNAFFGGVDGETGKRYANVIASRWSLRPVEPGWARAPWPQLLTRATVTIDGQEIDVISAHMPNGSGNGWKKIDTFDALAEALASSAKMPRILGGDFNEPWKFTPDGDLVSFGANRDRDEAHWFVGNRTGPKTDDGHPPVSRPRTEWNEAVRAVLRWGAPHGLRHVHHTVHGLAAPAVTHVVRGTERFFDHVLVSKDFDVEDSGFFHDWRTAGPSDHSAAWARLRLA
jgi:endonuclease/exonuclease/phosphatase family metal-dependent hydrolase